MMPMGFYGVPWDTLSSPTEKMKNNHVNGVVHGNTSDEAFGEDWFLFRDTGGLKLRFKYPKSSSHWDASDWLQKELGSHSLLEPRNASGCSWDIPLQSRNHPG